MNLLASHLNFSHTILPNGSLVIHNMNVSKEGLYSCVGIKADSTEPPQTFSAQLSLACKFITGLPVIIVIIDFAFFLFSGVGVFELFFKPTLCICVNLTEKFL